MKKYRIVTRSYCYTEYFVNAESEDEAKDKYYDGEYYDDKDIEFSDEYFVDINEVANLSKE